MTEPSSSAPRRLLLLSYAFPPATSPEAMLSAKRAGNIPGWEVEAICAAPFHPAMGNDPDMAAYAEARFARVHRLQPALRVPWHRLGLLGQLPDGLRQLNGQAARLAAQRHRMHAFDAMLSWSTYHSVHLAALRLKRRLGLPWLAHMSDPWVDNPFVRHGRAAVALNRHMERSVIAAADRLLLTSPETADLMMAKYPVEWREKAVVIPHAADPSLYSGAAPLPPANRTLVLRYLGNFYGLRSPEPLFEALSVVLRQEPETLKDVVIEIVGKLDPGMADTEAARRLPAGMVRILPPVGYRRSLELMETADLLLIVDAPARLSVFLPSKLVDYLGARRPILALTPPGASWRVTREAGYWTAPPDDAGAAAQALAAALRAVRSGTTPAKELAGYTVAATGAMMARLLGEVVLEARPANPTALSDGA